MKHRPFRRTSGIAAGLTTLLAVGLAVAEPTDAKPPACQLLLTVFEDGSWGADEAYVDGHQLTDTWLITAARHQGQTWRNSRGQTVLNVGAPALHRGQPCDLIVSGMAG